MTLTETIESSRACSVAALPQLLSTAAAAMALGRQPCTLRRWSCMRNGPLVPVRVNGRLGWPLHRIQALLSAEPLSLDAAECGKETA
jgi:hypothetical protein